MAKRPGRDRQKLKGLMEELKKQLLDIKPKFSTTIGKFERPRVEEQLFLG